MRKKINMVPVPKLKKLIQGTGTEIIQLKKAFTLVELIVVITILAILATVGFVSFSGYLAGTRDVNRISQLKSMSDALELYRTKKDLPIPDDKVDIKASGSTIAYQGYIGKNVLETIEYTESGLDPKDKNYFSYYLTKNKKYFQLMSFLEEPSEDVVAINNKVLVPSLKKGIPGTGTDEVLATDYSERYPKTTGKKLGILTDENNTPIQEIPAITGSGYLDIKIETSYVAYVDNGKKLVGKEIGGLDEVLKLGGVEQNLVAWYDFESINGTGLLDLSGHHYTGKIIGNFNKIHTGSIGPVGKAMKFDGDNISDYIILSNEIFDNKKDFSISIWRKFDNNVSNGNFYFSVASTDNKNKLLMGEDGFKEYISIKYPFKLKNNNLIEKNKWAHIFFLKNNSEISLYINGKKILYDSSPTINNIYLDAKGITIGQEQDSILGGFDVNQAMKGELDDLRIYEGVMSEGRIEKIYKLGKITN